MLPVWWPYGGGGGTIVPKHHKPTIGIYHRNIIRPSIETSCGKLLWYFYASSSSFFSKRCHRTIIVKKCKKVAFHFWNGKAIIVHVFLPFLAKK
jgi:hypothetical protein